MNTEALTAYLKEEISASDLSQLLDEHLHTMIQLCAASGEVVTQEQASAYHHIRRLRDLFAQLSAEASCEGGARKVEHIEAIAS